MLISKNDRFLSPTSSDADSLNRHLGEQFQAARTQRDILYRYVEGIRSHRSNWLNQLLASPHEKELLVTFWQKQEQALNIVLEERNAGLAAIGQAQLSFIREVCESAVISSRSQVQLSRSKLFQKHFLLLNEELEALNSSFFQLLEGKIAQMEMSMGHIRALHARQIDCMLEHWESTYRDILDDFSQIINFQTNLNN